MAGITQADINRNKLKYERERQKHLRDKMKRRKDRFLARLFSKEEK